jgi:hypothetical protein
MEKGYFIDEDGGNKKGKVFFCESSYVADKSGSIDCYQND